MESAKSLPLPKNPGVERNLWLKMRRTDQQTPRRLSLELCTFRIHEIDTLLSTCLVFKTIISTLNVIGMTWTEIPHLSLLSCYIPLYNAPGWQFFELLSQPFPQVNMRTTESFRIIMFWIWRHIRPSTHAPLNSVVNQKWQLLGILWRGIEIRGFKQIKKILHQITPRNKPY